MGTRGKSRPDITDDRVIEAVERCGSYTAAARELDVTPTMIRYRCQRAGYASKHTSARYPDITNTQVIEVVKRCGSQAAAARELGVSTSTIYYRLRQAGQPLKRPKGSTRYQAGLTPEKVHDAIQALGSMNRAAKALGVSTTTIRKRLLAGGYSIPDRGASAVKAWQRGDYDSRKPRSDRRRGQ